MGGKLRPTHHGHPEPKPPAVIVDPICFPMRPLLRCKAKQKRLRKLICDPRTLVFYESPHRLKATLEAMACVFGADREAAVCRELTKRYETVITGGLQQIVECVQADPDQLRGEMVVLVKGCVEEAGDEEGTATKEAERVLQVLLEGGELSVKTAVAMAAKLTGLKKNSLKDMALVLRGGKTAA